MAINQYFNEFTYIGDEANTSMLADMLAESSAELYSIGRDPITDLHPNSVDVSGSYSSISIEDDIQYFCCDLTCYTPFETRGAVPSGIWFGTVFGGEMHSRFGDKEILFRHNADPQVVSFGSTQQYIDRPGINEPIKMASFFVTENFFDRQLRLNEDTALAAMKAMIRPGVHQNQIQQSDLLSQTLERLYNSPYQGQTDRLFLESTVIATVFQLAPTKTPEPSESGSLLPRQLSDLAMEAQRYIDESPDQFKSIRSLAKELSTNETTLQRQFKEKFGLTLFQYVLSRRMHAARLLIKDGQLQIAEIAYRVGYNSPANFSTAYRRFYGHSPQNERAKS